jgi:hypothetical protein
MQEVKELQPLGYRHVGQVNNYRATQNNIKHYKSVPQGHKKTPISM